MTPERKAFLLDKMKAAVVSEVTSSKTVRYRTIPLAKRSHIGLESLRNNLRNYLKRVAGDVPKHILDDAVQDVVVGVLRGDLHKGNLQKTALAALRRYRREEGNAHRFLSIDDAGNRLADRLDSLQFHF